MGGDCLIAGLLPWAGLLPVLAFVLQSKGVEKVLKVVYWYYIFLSLGIGESKESERTVLEYRSMVVIILYMVEINVCLCIVRHCFCQ